MNSFNKFQSYLVSSPKLTIKAINDHLYFCYPNGKHQEVSPKRALAALIHGDEQFGLELFNFFLEQILDGHFEVNEPFALILGNDFAYQQNRRFIDIDLNRLWGKRNLGESYEEKIVAKVGPYLVQFDYLIDFHQSRHYSLGPFAVPSYHPRNYSFVRYLDDEMPICFFPDGSDKGTGMPLCSYLTSQEKWAITLEMGSIKDKTQQKLLDKGLQIIKRFFSYQGENIPEKRDEKNLFFFESTLDKNLGDLLPHVANMMPVGIGEVIGKYHDGRDMVSPVEGVIIFPQFDKSVKRESALCYFMKKR